MSERADYNHLDSNDRVTPYQRATQTGLQNDGILVHSPVTKPRAFPPGTKGRVVSYCNARDPICQGLGQLALHGMGVHTAYLHAQPLDAAEYLAKRLAPAAPSGGTLVMVDGKVGPLRLDQSTLADVERFAGTPSFAATGNVLPSWFPSYRVLSYNCKASAGVGLRDPIWSLKSNSIASGHFCQTTYFINLKTGTLAAFWTGSAAFHTSAGTHPEITEADSSKKEGKPFTGTSGAAIDVDGGAALLAIQGQGGKLVTNVPPGQPYEWEGGYVNSLALESKSNPIGLTQI